MKRRSFFTGAALLPGAAAQAQSRVAPKKKYRAGVIGLGWTGLLYDLAQRTDEKFNVDDINRPTPPLDMQRRVHFHNHPGEEGLPQSYSVALDARPDVELVAGAERDPKRLAAFGERFGLKALYTDAIEMMRKERLDIVAVCTNTKGRSFLTVKAAELGAKGIVAEKPMCHTLAEADAMVKACADRKVPLSAGAISTTHPSFGRAKQLVRDGVIGELISIESGVQGSQHQNWAYFVDGKIAWVSGAGGQGMAVTSEGLAIHFRRGAPGVRLSGSKGEIIFDRPTWKLNVQLDTPAGRQSVVSPWPDPQFVEPYHSVYTIDDVVACMDGRMDEPKNSGRRVAMAIEVEIALRESSQRGGDKVNLPLADRSLGLTYDWFR
ncbi:MAG: Gfo/Idh/MocA family oxidoreductase [Acidobacteria bacterium]|nr:Gfo/Idh/MocA family oxidoreductase [Acidobacteriota bacterium]